jgi:predicted ATP-grasp superfamily ATP-dependent carboligase
MPVAGPAWVTDANNRVALAVIRSLGRRGIPVAACAFKTWAASARLGFSSRYVRRRLLLPEIWSEGWIDLLDRSLGKEGLLLPVSINTLLGVLSHRERFCGRLVLLPEYAVLREVNSKLGLRQHASACGIPMPQRHEVQHPRQLEKMDRRAGFPLVVKLESDEGLFLPPQERYAVVGDVEELISAYKRLFARKAFPVVEEYVEGEGYGLSLLCEGGRVWAHFCHRRLLEYPPGGGPAALCESVFDPGLLTWGRSFARQTCWNGIMMMEFKRRPDGSFVLLEVNPRFWGSLPLAMHCGIDFPYLLYRLSMGQPPAEPPVYRLGVRMRISPLDLLSAARASLAAWQKMSGVFRCLADWESGRVPDGICQGDDPAPARVFWRRGLPI